MAHITGGGLVENPPRVLADGQVLHLDLAAWTLPPVFAWLARAGRLGAMELLRTFNCGIGMVLVADPARAGAVGATLEACGETVRVIGRIGSGARQAARRVRRSGHGMARRRTAVLISGGGSNLQALLDATAPPGASATIALVVSNEPRAFGLERARRAGVATFVLDHRGFADRTAFETELDRQLRDAGIDLICLAGFMRILTPAFVAGWRDRLLNIHPSLLPAFPGLHTHARALAAGVRVHGCTVHLVRPELDDGPILAQGIVPVLPGDDAASLAARVLEVEHRCYPLALEQVASGVVSGSGLVLHPMVKEF